MVSMPLGELNMTHGLEDAVRELIRNNPEASAAFEAISKRRSAQFAQVEVARAIVGCLWEVNKGMPNRLPLVLLSLAAGRRVSELFAESFYDGGTLSIH
jgi:hypothetical protein